jgi:hypothetical protein
MMHIDRVRTEMEVLSGKGGDTRAGAAQQDDASFGGGAPDPAARQPISAMVLEALREHMRELERQGTL